MSEGRKLALVVLYELYSLDSGSLSTLLLDNQRKVRALAAIL